MTRIQVYDDGVGVQAVHVTKRDGRAWMKFVDPLFADVEYQLDATLSKRWGGYVFCTFSYCSRMKDAAAPSGGYELRLIEP